MEFYPMTKIPERASNLQGVPEDFSITVLIFDKENPTFCDLGYYDFDFEEWTNIGEEEITPVCWCHIPDPTEYFMKTLISVELAERRDYSSTSTHNVIPYNNPKT